MKNESIFDERNLRLFRSVQFANGSKIVLKLDIQRRRSIPNRETCRPRSVDDTELGHFALWFCGGRQRNVQRFITHVHSYCFAD